MGGWLVGGGDAVVEVVEMVVTLHWWWCDYRPSTDDVERRRGCAIRFLAVSRGFFFLYCRKFNQAYIFSEYLLINYVYPVRKKWMDERNEIFMSLPNYEFWIAFLLEIYTERKILLKYVKILLDAVLKIILDHQNNYAGYSNWLLK